MKNVVLAFIVAILTGCGTALVKPTLQVSNEIELGCGFKLRWVQFTGATAESDATSLTSGSPIVTRQGPEQSGCKIVMDLHQIAGSGPSAAQQRQRFLEALLGAGAQVGTTALLPGTGKSGGIGIKFSDFGNSTAGAGTNTDVDINSGLEE